MSAETQTQVLATQYFMSTHSNVTDACSELYRLGIKTSFNDELMIFSTQHASKNNITNAYAQECNGLILEKDTWKPLVVPPRSLRFNIDTDASNKFLHQGLYHIYKAEDGTCFNMYFRNSGEVNAENKEAGRWVISTARGYDMNNVKWDSKTYQEIISECLERIGLTWETFTAQLNVEHCYSFGFKHPSFHKFFEGKDTPVYKIWFIQSVNLEVNSEKYLWASDKSPIAIINNQEVYAGPVGNLRELYKLASCSLDDFIGVGTVCYGFILRSANFEQTEYHSDLFIESILMRTIRKFWYENTIINKCHKNNWTKEKTITLYAFLDTSNYELFRILFKQYANEMEQYVVMLNEISNLMVRLVKEPNALESEDRKGEMHEQTRKYLETSKNLLQSFKDTIRYNINNKSAEQLKKAFYEFICHPNSLEFLM